MKICRVLGPALAPLGVLLLAGATVLASSVTLVVAPVEGPEGGEVKVPLTVRQCEALGAIQLDLTYDPQVLEVRGVEKGSMSAEIFIEHNVVAPGRLRIVLSTSASGSVNGDGALVVATFIVRGKNGQQCALGLEAAKAWDNTRDTALPYEMMVAVEPGKFSVTGGAAAPLPTGVIIGGAAAVVLVLLLVAATRKKA